MCNELREETINIKLRIQAKSSDYMKFSYRPTNIHPHEYYHLEHKSQCLKHVNLVKNKLKGLKFTNNLLYLSGVSEIIFTNLRWLKAVRAEWSFSEGCLAKRVHCSELFQFGATMWPKVLKAASLQLWAGGPASTPTSWNEWLHSGWSQQLFNIIWLSDDLTNAFSCNH